MIKILLIGSGGREHALAWRLAQSPKVSKVYVAPGNAGTAHESKVENLHLSAHEDLIAFVQKNDISFTLVGPEAPLAAGVVDAFRAKNLKIFGPTQAAARLESSKDFAKSFMQRHNIPTAAYQTFTDAAEAHAYVDRQGAPIVIKADGLAAGKGVVVAETLEQAHTAIDKMIGGDLGQAGARVVIEEFMEGEEASFIVLCDGVNALPLATSQDHKRLFDGDQGPNTGGMGAYSPAPVVTKDVHNEVMERIIRPTLEGMATEGHPFTGFLYAGLMITDQGPRVVEYNCRMGDPETQPIMMRLQSDLSDIIAASFEQKLDQQTLQWDPRPALGIVMAAKFYPNTPQTDDPIYGLYEAATISDTKVFHASTKLSNEQILTAGGRVLCVTALGDTIKQAQYNAYSVLRYIQFEGMQYRLDIGWRATEQSL